MKMGGGLGRSPLLMEGARVCTVLHPRYLGTCVRQPHHRRSELESVLDE